LPSMASLAAQIGNSQEQGRFRSLALCSLLLLPLDDAKPHIAVGDYDTGR
jgi:hypothetical protein